MVRPYGRDALTMPIGTIRVNENNATTIIGSQFILHKKKYNQWFSQTAAFTL